MWPRVSPDAAYTAAGATVTSRKEVLARSEVIAVVRFPEGGLVDDLRSGQLVIGLLDPLNHLATLEKLADRGVTAVAFELLPRTLSRAQSMDALIRRRVPRATGRPSSPRRRSGATCR